MSTGETVKVKVAGEDLLLPTTMGVLRQLARAEVCPMFLSAQAAMTKKPMHLSLDQACTILAIGMNAAGIRGATPETVWQAARRRPMGCPEVSSAALDYLTAFVSLMPDTETPPEVAGASPKE